MTLESGTRLGPYEIVSLRGKGGMGEVYRARDTRLDRDVAIKVLPAELSEDETYRKRQEREAKAMSQLQHPHVCMLLDIGSEGGTQYLVMEYLEGETLEDRLGKGALPIDEVLRIGGEIAAAIEAAHRRKIVHRDLKPGNVMLTEAGTKVLDFGLAKGREIGPVDPNAETETMTQAVTKEGRLVGTLPYMAPEQLRGDPADSRTDIWALGCVLYEMATGDRPFQGKSQADLIGAIMGKEPEPVSRVQPLTPARFSRVVRRCLAKDPEDRWQTASDVIRELARSLDTTPEPPNDETTLASAGLTDSSAPNHPATMRSPDTRTRVALLLGGLGAAVTALYLTNPSLRDAFLYPLLAIVGAPPTVVLVAAIGGLDTKTAALQSIQTLGSLGGTALSPQGRQQRRTLGMAFALFLGAILSILLSHGANQLMPYLRFLPHASIENTEWALNDPDEDWKIYRTQYKSAFLAHSDGTEADWQAQKHSLGRGSIRATRTLFSFALLLLIAGAIDLSKRRYQRGLTALILAIGTALILYPIWYSGEGQYVREMVSASSRLPEGMRPQLPASSPDGLQRLLRAMEVTASGVPIETDAN